jgi:hypothetical protein
MTYEKPEVTVLGEAVSLIQGTKPQVGESSANPGMLDSELDD